MRIIVLNTGTELLLGDVRMRISLLSRARFFRLGFRVEEQRTVPDGEAIRHALAELFSRVKFCL